MNTTKDKNGEYVESVILIYENHKTIPPEIFQMTRLKNLSCGLSDIKDWDDPYGYYRTIDYNDIDTIPAEIGNLINLEKLDFSDNKITSLPHEIGTLRNIKYLNIENSRDDYLKEISGYSEDRNHITVLPKEIGNLLNLEELLLAYNDIGTLPIEMLKLGHLKTLDLRGNA